MAPKVMFFYLALRSQAAAIKEICCMEEKMEWEYCQNPKVAECFFVS